MTIPTPPSPSSSFNGICIDKYEYHVKGREFLLYERSRFGEMCERRFRPTLRFFDFHYQTNPGLDDKVCQKVVWSTLFKGRKVSWCSRASTIEPIKTTQNIVLIVTYFWSYIMLYLFCYCCRFFFHQVKIVMFYNAQTTNLTFVV